MNDEITLLPCPFCGNAKNLAMVNEKHDHSGGFFIACPECGASTIMRYAMGDDPKPLLIEAWNRRAAVQAAQPEAVGEPVLWQFRWTNPGNDEGVRMAELEWKTVVPSLWNQTMAERIAELEAYRYSGKPVYEVRALGVLASAPTPEPMSAPTAEPVCDGCGKTIPEHDRLLRCSPPATPPSAATPEPSDAERDVLAERKRQINVEGYNAAEDDEYDEGTLAQAAACYATALESTPAPMDWPWPLATWKPKTFRSNLVRAGALILAEIERLDRATKGGKL